MFWSCLQASLILVFSGLSDTTTISTSHGELEGKTIELFNGKEVDAFLGVPYSAPPLGDNRFAPPQPLIPWNGTLQSTNYHPTCIQAATDHMKKTKWFVADLPESEDCLYLNIWTSKGHSPTDKKPIMIFLFSGGFFSGSSNLPVYDGSILASEENVVVASMNYRLAMLGFLYLNSSSVPGNMGLQDQIQAISWIKQNAEAFGGDPDRITLFGESAGSIAVGFHLLNMNIYDLFNNGIMESGPVAMPTITISKEQAYSKAISYAESLKCPTDDYPSMLACLRAKPVEELFEGHHSVPKYMRFEFPALRNGIEVPLYPLTAVKEIPENKRKDLMGGTIPREFVYYTDSFTGGSDISDDTVVPEEYFRTILKDVYAVSDEKLQNLVLFQLREFDRKFNRSQLRYEVSKLISDPSFICLQRNFTKSWATDTNKVFYYSFELRPSKAIKSPIPEWAGAVHGDEVPFVFGLPLDSSNGYTDSENELAKQVMQMWANFARTGDPNGDVTSARFIWPRLKPNQNFMYLSIDRWPRATEFFMEEDCSFWEEVLPDIQKLQEQLNQVGSTQ